MASSGKGDEATDLDVTTAVALIATDEELAEEEFVGADVPEDEFGQLEPSRTGRLREDPLSACSGTLWSPAPSFSGLISESLQRDPVESFRQEEEDRIIDASARCATKRPLATAIKTAMLAIWDISMRADNERLLRENSTGKLNIKIQKPALSLLCRRKQILTA